MLERLNLASFARHPVVVAMGGQAAEPMLLHQIFLRGDVSDISRLRARGFRSQGRPAPAFSVSADDVDLLPS
jgi:hypothetical protein